MKNLITLCISFLLVFICSSNAIGQKKISVHGRVVDTTGLPIAGASIKLDAKVGTMTNDKGEFFLSLSSNSKTIHLQVSYVGYTTISVSLKPPIDSIINVVLKIKEGKSNLNEVVIIGSQQISRRNLTAAVSSISGNVVQNLPSASVDQLLQGRIAGLNVQVASGEPGVTPTIVVRGNSTVNTNIGNSPTVAQAQALSSPLYVIDGVPIDPSQISNNYDVTGTNYLAGINVNDIASVDVEKDAVATAAWGSRGANGVIIITTRKATSKSPSFDVNFYTGINTIPKLIPTYTGDAERQEIPALILRGSYSFVLLALFYCVSLLMRQNRI